jgi:hypothetical protein
VRGLGGLPAHPVDEAEDGLAHRLGIIRGLVVRARVFGFALDPVAFDNVGVNLLGIKLEPWVAVSRCTLADGEVKLGYQLVVEFLRAWFRAFVEAIVRGPRKVSSSGTAWPRPTLAEAGPRAMETACTANPPLSRT